MSKRIVQLSIECGDRTCYYAYQKSCRFVGVKRFGTEYVCMLFPSDSDGSNTPLKEDEDPESPTFGRLLRCDSCMSSEFKQ